MHRNGPPSRIPNATGLPRLQEITDSENNARAPTAMPPPGFAQKHKPSGRMFWNSSTPQPFASFVQLHDSLWGPLSNISDRSNIRYPTVPEPPSKQRKTLADRAGEPYTRPNVAPPSTRPMSSTVKATVAAGTRNNSYSSNSSRYPSGSSRHTSSSSTSSLRPTSVAGHYRPQSAMSLSRSNFSTSHGSTRPATSLETHAEEHSPSQKRNGIVPFSRSPSPSQDTFVQVRRRRPRDQNAPQRGCDNQSRTNARSAKNNGSVQRFRDVSVTTAMQTLSINGKEERSMLETSCQPTTPSGIPKPVVKEPPSTPQKESPIRAKSQRRPRKSCSPSKTPQFLTKSSNVQAATWDTDTRLDAMEKLHNHFKEQLESFSGKESSHQEQINLYKTRGKPWTATITVCVLTGHFSLSHRTRDNQITIVGR